MSVKASSISEDERRILRIAEESGDPILLANIRHGIKISQIDREADEVVRIDMKNDSWLGLGKEGLLRSLARASYRALKRNRLVEGFDFEDQLVASYLENDIPAWDDENKANRGADVYIARKRPASSVIEYLESRGNRKWHENLFYRDNKPWVRFEDGSEFELPASRAKVLARSIVNVSLKTKANKQSNDQELEYHLMNLTEEVGSPRFGRTGRIDYEWLQKALAGAEDHTANYQTSVIGHIVPEIEGENVNVRYSLRELPDRLLQDRVKEANEKLQMIAGSPNPAELARAFEPEMQITKSQGTTKVTFFTFDQVSISGINSPIPCAEQIEFAVNERGVSVHVHTDELETAASFVHPAPLARAKGFMDGAKANMKRQAYADSLARDEEPPKDCAKSIKPWWRPWRERP